LFFLNHIDQGTYLLHDLRVILPSHQKIGKPKRDAVQQDDLHLIAISPDFVDNLYGFFNRLPFWTSHLFMMLYALSHLFVEGLACGQI
jgi:hypothetical protein